MGSEGHWAVTRDFKENKNKDEKLLSNLNILKFSLEKVKSESRLN